MIRFISILSIFIVIVFFLSRFDFTNRGTESTSNELSFEEFVIDAIERNTPDRGIFSFSFSLEDLFGRESRIFQQNLHQILLRQELQENFSAIINRQKLPFSIERTYEDIQREGEKERRLLFPNDRNTQRGVFGNRNIGQDSVGVLGGCSGLIFDPCITIFESVPPPGMIDFGVDRWNTPL